MYYKSYRIPEHKMLYLVTIAFIIVAASDTSAALPRPAGFWPLTKRYQGLDVSGNGNHGIVEGVDFDEGIYGVGEGSAKFAGTASSYIEIPNNGALHVSSFTWLAYVRVQDMSNDGPLFDFAYGAGNYNHGTHIWCNTNGHLFICPVYKEPYTLLATYSLPVLSDTAWVYAGISYDYQTGMLRLWADGLEAGQLQHTAQLQHNTEYIVRMGARHTSAGDTRYFSGAVKCVQLYGTALSAEQIQQTVELCRDQANESKFDIQQNASISSSLIYGSQSGMRSILECATLCMGDTNCLSLNYVETTATCELSRYSGLYNNSLEAAVEGKRHAKLLHPVN